MSVNAMIAMQTRIERQDAPQCASVSFERHAAYAFQSYVASTLAFSVKVRDLGTQAVMSPSPDNMCCQRTDTVPFLSLRISGRFISLLWSF